MKIIDDNQDEKAINNHALIGKSILVGLTYRDHRGNVTEQQQIFGEITKIAEEDNTMEVDEPDGTYWTLPYFPMTILEPPRGIYKCRVNALEIRNPELLMSWQITIAQDENEPHDWKPNITAQCQTTDDKFAITK